MINLRKKYPEQNKKLEDYEELKDEVKLQKKIKNEFNSNR